MIWAGSGWGMAILSTGRAHTVDLFWGLQTAAERADEFSNNGKLWLSRVSAKAAFPKGPWSPAPCTRGAGQRLLLRLGWWPAAYRDTSSASDVRRPPSVRVLRLFRAGNRMMMKFKYGFKKWHNLCNVQRLISLGMKPLLRCSKTVQALVISEITKCRSMTHLL